VGPLEAASGTLRGPIDEPPEGGPSPPTRLLLRVSQGRFGILLQTNPGIVQARSRRSIDGISFVCLAAHEVEFRRWRPLLSLATPGIVKLLLPPRQSRGISLGY
jgi:hypothetical protein